MKYRFKIPVTVKLFGAVTILITVTILYKVWLGGLTPHMSMSLDAPEDDTYYHGTLRSIGFPQYCLDSLYSKRNHNEIGVRHCPLHTNQPPENQNWALTKTQYLRRQRGGCLEGTRWGMVQLTTCKKQNNRLYWFYDHDGQLLLEHFSRKCLEIDPKEQKVYLMICNEHEEKQKWEFAYHNLGQFMNLADYSDDNAEMTMVYD